MGPWLNLINISTCQAAVPLSHPPMTLPEVVPSVLTLNHFPPPPRPEKPSAPPPTMTPVTCACPSSADSRDKVVASSRVDNHEPLRESNVCPRSVWHCVCTLVESTSRS